MRKTALERLKELDAQSVKFLDARRSMLAEGFSEAEILDGIYRFNYDAKPGQPPKADKVKAYYEQHPEAAKAIADELLKAQKADLHYARASRVVGNMYAMRWAPGHHARARALYEFSRETGSPYFSLLLLIALTTVLVIIFKLPGFVLYAVPITYILGFTLFNWWRNR